MHLVFVVFNTVFFIVTFVLKMCESLTDFFFISIVEFGSNDSHSLENTRFGNYDMNVRRCFE